MTNTNNQESIYNTPKTELNDDSILNNNIYGYNIIFDYIESSNFNNSEDQSILNSQYILSNYDYSFEDACEEIQKYEKNQKKKKEKSKEKNKFKTIKENNSNIKEKSEKKESVNKRNNNIFKVEKE